MTVFRRRAVFRRPFALVVYVLDRKLLSPRTADVTVTKIAGYVRVRILMNR